MLDCPAVYTPAVAGVPSGAPLAAGGGGHCNAICFLQSSDWNVADPFAEHGRG